MFYPDSAYMYWWRTAWPNFSRDLVWTTGAPMRLTPRHRKGLVRVILAVLAVLAYRRREVIRDILRKYGVWEVLRELMAKASGLVGKARALIGY